MEEWKDKVQGLEADAKEADKVLKQKDKDMKDHNKEVRVDFNRLRIYHCLWKKCLAHTCFHQNYIQDKKFKLF